MKNNLENSFRKSLENFEMPYNPAAWTKMSAKLDATMSVKGTQLKWYVAAGVLIVTAFTSSLFFFSSDHDDEKSTIAKKIEQKQSSIEEKSNTADIKTVSTENTEKQIEENQSSNTGISTDEITNQLVEVQEKIEANKTNATVEEEENVTKENKPKSINNNTKDSKAPVQDNKTHTVAPKSIIIPTIPSVCVGEEIEIKNENDSEMLIGGPWYNKIIKPHSTAKLIFKNEGTYVVGPKDTDRVNSQKTFIVKELPTVDITIDENIKYKDGLPTIQLSSHAEGEITWEYENIISRGKQITPHFFKKGNHTIKITIEGENGCVNSSVKDIYIDENYNLMAVNSFIPNDNDIRRSSFMPYALTQRTDVRFTLLIIDPTDGHAVYQTNDVTEGWTGIDQQTGQHVKFEKAYIWKVIIDNPVKGEKGEYAGTITPLTR